MPDPTVMTGFADPEVIPVRAGETLETTRLEPYLRRHLLGATGGETAAQPPLSIAQFGGGHANLTYMIAFGERQFVLRRPPLGPVAPSAHDMGREHRVLSRLYQAFPLAPRSFLLCDDDTIIGAPFHVMERRSGLVIRSQMPERFANQPQLNQRLGHMLVDTLAALHGIDPATIGLGDLGRPEGFVQRQLHGWGERWQAAKDRELEQMTRLQVWLQEQQPQSRHVSLLHNDFKLDNMIVADDDPARPIAVLDWDMCTRGDPLLDLGNMLNYYAEAGDPESWRTVTTMPSWHDGFPSRRQLVERYAERTGLDVSQIHWYHAFGAFKLAVVLQQIYIRYVRGQTQDRRFAQFDRRVAELAAKGCAIAGIH